MDRHYSAKEIAHLIIICHQGTANSKEREALKVWLSESEANRGFYERVTGSSYCRAAFQEYAVYDSLEAWGNVKPRICPKQRSYFRRLYPYAALLCLALGIAGMIIFQSRPSDQPLTVLSTDIVPGKAMARLVLENGRIVNLETTEEHVLQNVEGEHFVNDGKKLVYQEQQGGDDSKMHVLQVPRRGEYHLVLADGTRVWLNAESELRYPDHFTGLQRQVELTGEAYFEVAKDSARPFYVVTDEMKIKVTGTSFNVRTYPGESRQATLAEGRIAVEHQGVWRGIHPGEQVVITSKGMEINPVKVRNYTGWKEQRFVYSGKLLEEIFRDLERWYDVEIVTDEMEVGQIQLTADLPKYENMDKVLEIIECAACIKFETKGRTLVVRTIQTENRKVR